MLRALIRLEPGGDKSRTTTVAEITIANITRGAGRVSDDYAWRIRSSERDGRQIVAYGCLADSYNGTATDLVWEVLTEWKSGRPKPTDNHGFAVTLVTDHKAFWDAADPDPEPLRE